MITICEEGGEDYSDFSFCHRTGLSSNGTKVLGDGVLCCVEGGSNIDLRSHADLM